VTGEFDIVSWILIALIVWTFVGLWLFVAAIDAMAKKDWVSAALFFACGPVIWVSWGMVVGLNKLADRGSADRGRRPDAR